MMDVSIIIVSHNHARYLPACLSSLKQASGRLTTEVLVIANSPGDGSAHVARAHLPGAQVIENASPRGFAANNNLGIRLSRGRYILLLNPDTVVEENAIVTLVGFMDAHPKVGICGPQLRFPDGRVQPSCRRFPTWRSVLARRTPLRHFLWNSRLNAHHLMADFEHDREQAVDWMLGACLMARRAAVDQVGLMDEGYTLYVEDIDWCYRMQQNGWDVYYVPSARVIHHHLAVSDRRWLTRQTVLHFQSMGRFVWKHYVRPKLTRSQSIHKLTSDALSGPEGRR